MVNNNNSRTLAVIQKKFGERVRTLRLQSKLSQEELAFQAGIHRTYLSGVERGERNIALRNIDAIARALGVSLSTLFDFEINTQTKKVTKI